MSARPTRLLISIVLLSALASSPGRSGRADEILLRDGAPVRGIVLKESERLVVVLVPGGIQTFPRARVAAVNRRPGDEGAAAASGSRVQAIERAGAATGASSARISARKRIADGNRKVALRLSGSLAGEEVDPGDEWVRGRIEQLLGSCDPALELVSAAAGADEADLHMTISVNVTLGSSVSFYGVSLGRNASSSLAFKLESKDTATSGDDAGAAAPEVRRVLLVQGAIDDSLMGASGEGDGGGGLTLPTRALRGAVDKLVKQLVPIKLFGIQQQPK